MSPNRVSPGDAPTLPVGTPASATSVNFNRETLAHVWNARAISLRHRDSALVLLKWAKRRLGRMVVELPAAVSVPSGRKLYVRLVVAHFAPARVYAWPTSPVS